MTKSQIFSSFFSMLILGAVVCSAAQAQLENPDLPKRTGMKLGDIAVLHTAFKTSEELETNRYLAPSKQKFDAITLLQPSAGLEIPFKENRISADYECSIYLYGKYHTENHIDHRGRGLIELQLTDYKIEISDTFRDYTDRSADENSRRIGRQDNKLRVSIGRDFENKFGFEIGYSNIFDFYFPEKDLIYQEISYQDRDRVTNVVDATLSYRIMPKTSIFIEEDMGFIHYFNSSLPPGSIYIDSLIGIKGRPTNKILINLKGGIRYQGYENATVYSDKSFIGAVAKGGLDYFISKDDTLTVVLERGVYESLYANMNYFEANIVQMKYLHRFNEKMSIGAYGSYQLHLYPTATTEGGVNAKRYDNFYNFGCTGRYDIRKWLSTEVRYDFTQKESRFSDFDYVDNRVIFSGTAGF